MFTLLYRWGTFLEKFPESNAVAPRARFTIGAAEPVEKDHLDSSHISVISPNSSKTELK